MNRTKADLEREIEELRIRVAGLEGAVTAYKYAFEHLNKPEQVYPDPNAWQWQGGWPNWYPHQPAVTPPFQITS